MWRRVTTVALFLDDNETNDVGEGTQNDKKIKFYINKQQLCTWITLFCTFLCHRCTTTTGGPTIEKARRVKKTATEIFAKATFTLHKWSSNARELELTETTESEVGLTYAKEQLGKKPGACGLLGLRWNKEDDKIALTFPTEIADPTKRGVLCKIAKIYDPIGLAAPVSLQGKIVYRNICKEKTAWDAEIPLQIANLTVILRDSNLGA